MKYEQKHSNHVGLRRISDYVDRMMGWTAEKKGKSFIRGFAHGMVHICFGIYKLIHGNRVGFKAELKRAHYQFTRKAHKKQKANVKRN